MGKDILQFRAVEDGCVYFYDPRRGSYMKICDVLSFQDLPLSVQNRIKAAKEEAAEIIRLPAE